MSNAPNTKQPKQSKQDLVSAVANRRARKARTKLTEDLVKAIQEDLAYTDLTQGAIATKRGVSEATVSRILNDLRGEAA